MKKYIKKLCFLMVVCLVGALLMFWMNRERQMEMAHRKSVVVMNQEPLMLAASDVENLQKLQTEKTALILYSPNEEASEQLKKNTEIVLDQMRISYDAVELTRTESVSYDDYDMVILASSYWEEEIADSMTRMTDYVEDGGRLLLGMIPVSSGPQFNAIYRKLGIVEYNDYVESDSLQFEEELIPGIADLSFGGEGFLDVCLAVGVEDNATVYAYAGIGNEQVPYIWNYECGDGKVTFFNGTAISGDFWRGMIAGCVCSLYDSFMYPVINASCIFIDDFPSPQYESTSDVVRKEYNRSVKEFYRDIWWPDMQRIAKTYGDVYTCLFVATYNDIVNPEEFTYTESSMEQYYGHSLLKNGHEMGAHGYNHQSLTLAGGTPEEFQYKPWKNTQDMTASLEKLSEISEQLFPTVNFETYVPPSNYLSQEGRTAIKEALPELKTISGIYTDEGEVGEVYVQNFEIAEDGIAEFPRVSAGMLQGDFDRFAIVNAIGTYGVFSHFIHPDDIFDGERGQGQNWETLHASYDELMSWVHSTYPHLREMSGSEAADALKVYQESVPYIIYEEDLIEGKINSFYGNMFFYLKTEDKPEAMDDSCVIQKADAVNGENFYIVTVKEAEFIIKLVQE